MSTTVYVEYLAGYLACVCQVENSADDVFDFHNFPHWLERLKKVLRIIFVQWCVHDARSDGVEANAVLRVLDCETPDR